MRIIPAVDIKNGKCVRLSQGRADRETVYSDSPADMAAHWRGQGARWLHVVDLDGAFTGQPANAGQVKDIIIRGGGMEVQVGGGIRSVTSIEAYLEAGASRVILGTIAQKDPKFVEAACRRFPGKILVGIDARDGNVAVKGWVEVTELKAVDLAKILEPMGVSGFIFTDITCDGMLQGPNLNSIRTFAAATRVPVIASGGVGILDDIDNLLPLGVDGVIVGKALYDKAFEYQEAVARAEKHAG